MNRRIVLKGVGLGLGLIAASGVAGYYYSVVSHLKHQSLTIGGSTTVKRFMDKLVAAFIQKNAKVDFLVDGGHSYAGLVALERGAVDIAMMSHSLTANEDITSIQNYLIGLEAVALVVNVKCPIDNISSQDARKILEKKSPIGKRWVALMPLFRCLVGKKGQPLKNRLRISCSMARQRVTEQKY